MIQGMQQNKLRLTILTFFIAFASACDTSPSLTMSKKGLIPAPVELTPSYGSFEITSVTRIYTAVQDEELTALAEYLKLAGAVIPLLIGRTTGNGWLHIKNVSKQ